MSRIPKFLGLLGLIVILLFSAFPAAAAAKSYFADRYDVTLTVQPDGALLVSETIVFRFQGGPFTYVFRDLEYANLDEIDRLQASMDGQVLPQGTEPGQVEVAVGKPLKVTWHFAPTSDAAHEFTLRYRVQGAIRQEASADTLIWRAIPEDHDYSIAHGTLRLEYPGGIAPLSAPFVTGASADLETEGQAVIFTVSNEIKNDTPLDVTVHFAPGSLVSQPPTWQAEQTRRSEQMAQALPFGLGALVVTGLIGLATIVLLGQRARRDESAVLGLGYDFTTPPQDLAPALAANLTGSSTSFLGTLFDLAARGVLRIEEGPRRWGSRSFEIVRQPGAEALRPHEAAFMQVLFAKAKNERVPISKIAALAGNKSYNKALKGELVSKGWFDAQRERMRNGFVALGVLSLVLGMGVFFAGISALLFFLASEAGGVRVGALMIGSGVALAGMGLIGMIAAAFISTLSNEGSKQATSWKSFAGYLRNITRGKEVAVSADTFGRYLPYAATFGMGTEWSKYFKKVEDVPVPEWFKGLENSMPDGSFVAIIAAISAADSSAASASAAGASGASGGGASGAG